MLWCLCDFHLGELKWLTQGHSGRRWKSNDLTLVLRLPPQSIELSHWDTLPDGHTTYPWSLGSKLNPSIEDHMFCCVFYPAVPAHSLCCSDSGHCSASTSFIQRATALSCPGRETAWLVSRCTGQRAREAEANRFCFLVMSEWDDKKERRLVAQRTAGSLTWQHCLLCPPTSSLFFSLL